MLPIDLRKSWGSKAGQEINDVTVDQPALVREYELEIIVILGIP